MLTYIKENPGVTSSQLADRYPVEHKTYGRQRFASAAVAQFRRSGWINDVAHRCSQCNGALTRSSRNVPLSVTYTGLQVLGRAAQQ